MNKFCSFIDAWLWPIKIMTASEALGIMLWALGSGLNMEFPLRQKFQLADDPWGRNFEPTSERNKLHSTCSNHTHVKSNVICTPSERHCSSIQFSQGKSDKDGKHIKIARSASFISTALIQLSIFLKSPRLANQQILCQQQCPHLHPSCSLFFSSSPQHQFSQSFPSEQQPSTSASVLPKRWPTQAHRNRRLRRPHPGLLHHRFPPGHSYQNRNRFCSSHRVQRSGSQYLQHLRWSTHRHRPFRSTPRWTHSIPRGIQLRHHCISRRPVKAWRETQPDAQFIFKIGTSLSTAASSKVVPASLAKSCNVFVCVGSSATIGADNNLQGGFHCVYQCGRLREDQRCWRFICTQWPGLAPGE